MFKKTALFFSPLLLIFGAACGGEAEVDAPEISVHAEAPGEECPTGGLHLIVDGQEFYLCNGADGAEGDHGATGDTGDSPVISTAQRAAGDGNNPCEGDALEITITNPGEDPVVEYVCQYYDPVVEFLGGYFEESMQLEAQAQASRCTCSWDEWDYDSLEECVESYQPSYAEQRFMTWCLDSAYSVYDRPAPEELTDFLQCQIDAAVSGVACGELFDDGDACTFDDFDAFFECRNDSWDAEYACYLEIEENNEELMEWLNEFDSFLGMYGCFAGGGMPS